MFKWIINTVNKKFLKKDKNDVWVKKYIINNPNASMAILEQLAFDNDDEVRAIIAKHINTSEYILEILSKDKTFLVKYCLLKNTNLTKNILIELSQDSNEFISKIAFHHLTNEKYKIGPES